MIWIITALIVGFIVSVIIGEAGQMSKYIIKTLLPFARAADDYEPPRSKRRLRDEEHVALSLTVGHLREARRMVLKLVEFTPAPDPNLIREEW